jgi:hypothetical protein
MAAGSVMRYLELLEPVADPELDAMDAGVVFGRQETTHGPLGWTSSCSAELQRVVDEVCVDELYNLNFSVTLADPGQPDCPLVACSAGFTELTGYTLKEIVGQNCRFMLNGVPPNLIDEDTRVKCRALCVSSSKGEEYRGSFESLPPGMQTPSVDLPRGELICVQTNARKSGELFRNMFYLKQVELDEKDFILGLQAGLPEEMMGPDCSFGDLQAKVITTFTRLEENMAHIQQVLAQQFWYSATMQRQI